MGVGCARDISVVVVKMYMCYGLNFVPQNSHV